MCFGTFYVLFVGAFFKNLIRSKICDRNKGMSGEGTSNPKKRKHVALSVM